MQTAFGRRHRDTCGIWEEYLTASNVTLMKKKNLYSWTTDLCNRALRICFFSLTSILLLLYMYNTDTRTCIFILSSNFTNSINYHELEARFQYFGCFHWRYLSKWMGFFSLYYYVYLFRYVKLKTKSIYSYIYVFFLLYALFYFWYCKNNKNVF